MKKLETIYLDIDEDNIQDGIDAISLVKFPAIEENWVALNEHKVELKTIDEDKRIVIGLALIPEKDIYRRNGDYEYNCAQRTVIIGNHVGVGSNYCKCSKQSLFSL